MGKAFAFETESPPGETGGRGRRNHCVESDLTYLGTGTAVLPVSPEVVTGGLLPVDLTESVWVAVVVPVGVVMVSFDVVLVSSAQPVKRANAPSIIAERRARFIDLASDSRFLARNPVDTTSMGIGTLTKEIGATFMPERPDIPETAAIQPGWAGVYARSGIPFRTCRSEVCGTTLAFS